MANCHHLASPRAWLTGLAASAASDPAYDPHNPMDLCYINLIDRPDRNTAFQKFNSHLPLVNRVDAAQARDIDVQKLISAKVMAGPLPNFPLASIAHALSHKRIWDHYAAKGEGVTIAEDDAVFSKHFLRNSARVLAMLPPDWDMILWGWNFDAHLDVEMLPGLKRCIMVFEGKKLDSKVEEFQQLDCVSAPLRVIGGFGTVAYSASPKGLKTLLRNCFPLKHELILMSCVSKAIWNCGLDVTLNKFFPTMKAYVCIPPLVWTENDKALSDIFPSTGNPSAG
jgi:glycosyl transferase, family 25